MNSRIHFFLGLVVLVLLVAAPARANHTDKGTSGYGGTDPNCGLGTPPLSNCQSTTELSGVFVDGSPVFSFTFVDTFGGSATTLFAFEIPDTITPGSILSLTFPSLAGLTYGAMYCNNTITSDPTVAVDAGGATMKDPNTLVNLPCTPALVPADPNTFFTESDTGNVAKFTFTDAAGLPSSFTFFTESLTDLPTDVGFTPGTSAMPEPGSLVLFSMGLIAVFGGLRRRSKNGAIA